VSVNLYHKKNNSQPRPALLLTIGRIPDNPKIPDSPSLLINPGQQGEPAFRSVVSPAKINFLLHRLVTNTTEEYALSFSNT